MPMYQYNCDSCGNNCELFLKKPNPPKTVKCRICKDRMKRIFGNVNSMQEDRERYSFAMGINPERIPEAVKIYPGSEYDHRGYLKIKNRKHKLFEMKRRGMAELE